jgi:AraC family transcriptional regulator
MVQTAGFLLTDTGYSPGFARSWHVHDTPEFCFVFDGAFRETVGRTELPGRRLDLSFKPAGEVHCSEAGRTGARCLVIEVPPSRISAADGLARALDAPLSFQNGALADLGLRLVREMGITDELAPLVIEGIALELLAQASRSRRAAASVRCPPWMNAVRQLLHDCFARRLGLSEIAASVGVHPAHLAQVFRRVHGCTIGEYLRLLRVDHARRQLAGSERTLADIAFASGFCDQGHFTRTFKRLTGATPGQYRRQPTGG